MNKALKIYFKQYPVALYIVLACGITWLCWITALVVSNKMGYVLPVQDVYIRLLQSGFTDISHLLISLVFILGGFGPLIATIVVVGLESGGSGIAELREQTFR